jgi:hypothetical protein
MAKVKVTEAAKPKAIAAQYGIGTKAFRELNKLEKGETVQAGTTVRLGPGVGPISPSRTAESLYVDPTPAFQPAMDFISQQMGQANTRYAANQADIKSIFGNLTTVRTEDKAKIKKQFEDSIANQQMSLAQRTAEARAGSEAGAQQLAVTAGERGEGPMPASTPVQRAAEEGIARSNEYQQTWEALQNVMSQQAQSDVQSAITGYNFQQASALEQLRNNLEQRLAGLEGQRVDVQSQLAGAQLQGRQGVMQANYGEIQARQAQAAALREAQARAAGSSGGTDEITGNYADLISFARSKGLDASIIADSIDDIDAGSYKNWQEAYSAWNEKYGKNLQQNKLGIQQRARQYFQDNYSSSSSSPSSTTYEKNIFGLQKRMADEGQGDLYSPMINAIGLVEDQLPQSYNDAIRAWNALTATGEADARATSYARFYFQNLWKAPPF